MVIATLTSPFASCVGVSVICKISVLSVCVIPVIVMTPLTSTVSVNVNGAPFDVRLFNSVKRSVCTSASTRVVLETRLSVTASTLKLPEPVDGYSLPLAGFSRSPSITVRFAVTFFPVASWPSLIVMIT